MQAEIRDEIYIGVGANLEPEKNILQSLELLAARVKITATSSFYRTKPADGRDEPDYYNGVWQIETSCSPQQLKFEILRNIEKALGRQRSGDKSASRCIDLDLLLYGNRVLHEAQLQLPDPAIYSYDFIVVPLYEINPGLVLPGSGKTLAGLVKNREWSQMVLLAEFTGKIRHSLHDRNTAGRDIS